MIRLFCGYDKREAKGALAFTNSLIEHSPPVALTWLTGRQFDGTNAFTYSRFDVPNMCGHEGFAIWMDGSDMLLRANIAELWDLCDERYAVQVVKHDYKTKHSRKYVGTIMEADNADYPRKNWSSLILWNCAHPLNKTISLDRPHRFGWLPDELIGSLPEQWNRLVGEQPVKHDDKLLHFTLGIPSFTHYAQSDGAEEWRRVA